jgi:hypothetical protein
LMEGLASCWQDLALLVSIVQLFQPKPSWSTAIKHVRLLLILFIISQWVYQMIIQAHLCNGTSIVDKTNIVNLNHWLFELWDCSSNNRANRRVLDERWTSLNKEHKRTFGELLRTKGVLSTLSLPLDLFKIFRDIVER